MILNKIDKIVGIYLAIIYYHDIVLHSWEIEKTQKYFVTVVYNFSAVKVCILFADIS